MSEQATQLDAVSPEPITQRYLDAGQSGDQDAVSMMWALRCNEAETDVGNGARFALDHKDVALHVVGRGWHVWDGVRWGRDDSGKILRLAQETVRAIRDEVRGLNAEEAKQRLRHSFASQRLPRIEALIKLGAVDERLIARVDDLDADSWLLNVANGTLHLRSGELREHRRDDLLTKLVPVEYQPDATCPRWLEFLGTVLAGDVELIEFVQRAVGYSLTGSTREQVLFVCHGSGANGKSTFIEILLALGGDYGSATPASTLLERQGGGDAIPNDLARLPGVRLVTAAETSDGRRLNEERIKALTGGDTVSARFMRGEWFDFQPAFKLWLATNHLPEVRRGGDALFRRVVLIPFEVKVAEADQDRDLPAKLRDELAGILRWAVEGCIEWQGSGLPRPTAVASRVSDYRETSDVLGVFLAECCEVASQLRQESKPLYTAFRSWAHRNGEEPLSQTALGRQLAERGFAARKASGGRRFRVGLKLKPLPTEGGE